MSSPHRLWACFGPLLAMGLLLARPGAAAAPPEAAATATAQQRSEESETGTAPESAPAPASASEPAPASASEPAPALREDSLARSRSLVRRGNDEFRQGDYDEAITLWTEAYQLLGSDRRRIELLHKIAKAHEKAYDIDGNPEHLEHALRLLDQYHGFIDPDDHESLAANDAQRQRVEVELRRRLEGRAAKSVEGPVEGPGPKAPSPSTPSDEAPEQALAWQRYRSHMTTGFVLVGLGTASTWASIALLSAAINNGRESRSTGDSEQQATYDRRSLLYTGAAVTTGVAAGALLITGAVLMIRASRRRPDRLGPTVRHGPRVRLGPSPAGLALHF